jgi:hypothetical protein
MVTVNTDTDNLSRWLNGVPPGWSIHYTHWHEVPWAKRRSVRDRSRLVTRRKQRRSR